MAKITNSCNTDCNKTFPQTFQEALANICFLGSVSGIPPSVADRRVAITSGDGQPSELINKLIGVSGVDFFVSTGVSGEVYVAALDLDFLDSRYDNQSENVLTFELNAGTHNGFVRPSQRIDDDFESLRYPEKKKPSSSWNTTIPKDYFPGETEIKIKWTQLNSVSGITLFDVKYNSVGTGDIIGSSITEQVSGLSDGTPLKVFETIVDVVSGIVEKNDAFMLSLTRRGDLSQDILEEIDILDVSLSYKEV